ncbi:hypothetical protein [Streptomyces olivaceus]|uniref:hypothetical protein n=1 Tax=Streptomyces olivaceus TaxID=47716 RepID=UPI00365CB696
MVLLGVIVLAGLGFWLVRKRYRYPGGWAFAFSPQYEGDREALDGPRREARGWARRAAQEEALARKTVAAAEADRDRRLHALAQRRERLRNPGSGERLGELGSLTLFRHCLEVKSGSLTHSVELAGMEVRFDSGHKHHYLYCTDSSGHPHQAKYPHLPAPPDTQEQRFDEDMVRDFMVKIQGAVAQENIFREGIPQKLKTVEDSWEETQNDTGDIDAARKRLEEIRERNREDPRSEVLEERLMEAFRKWEELTGRTPPR